jgi:hypothetical protein
METVGQAQRSVKLKAIFAHLDVLGAIVNNKQQMYAGLSPSALPQDVPVFTGHYHKPHTVPNSVITYVGSPFQRALLTFSQSHQPLATISARLESTISGAAETVQTPSTFEHPSSDGAVTLWLGDGSISEIVSHASGL